MAEHWYNKRVPTLLGILASLLVVAVIVLLLLSPAHAAAPATDPGSSTSFAYSGQATLVPAADMLAIQTDAQRQGFACPVAWRWAPSGWGVKTLSGAWWYAFTTKVIWCVDKDKTRINGLQENRCINLGGFWNFDWCKHDHSKAGYGSMDLWPTFEYYLPKTGIYRHPHIDYTVYPNGGVTGTAYSDASTICSYPAGNDCHG